MRSIPDLSLKASAAVMWVGALGIGVTATLVASYLLREHVLPVFMGIRLFGGGMVERWRPEAFVVLLGLFTATCALQLFAGWLVWDGQRFGAILVLALLPIEVIFWIAFALPFPPLFAVIRLALLAVGWSALR